MNRYIIKFTKKGQLIHRWEVDYDGSMEACLQDAKSDFLDMYGHIPSVSIERKY